ncbi:MAG: hypothetical protein ACLT9W_03430, partial [Streptococcus sp.]
VFSKSFYFCWFSFANFSLCKRNLRLGFSVLKSSSSFSAFQTSAAETKFPFSSRKDIGLSPTEKASLLIWNP